MTRKGKLSILDWVVIGGLLLFSVIPDPTDAVDMMLPIVEPLLAYIYYNWRTTGKPLPGV